MKTPIKTSDIIGYTKSPDGRFYLNLKNFIPENRKLEGSAKRGSGKQEIAPFTWEVAPEGKRSLYRQFAGVFGKVIDGVAVLMCSEQTLAYFRTSRDEAQELINRWNAGERWV